MKIDNRSWACGRRVLMASMVTLAAAGVLAADQAAAQDVKRGGTLVIARPEEPLSWNPYTQGDNGSIYAIEQVCDSLVEADATGHGLRPGLAESWEMAPDGLTYTFKLRDAKFSDGAPVTVDDVVFSWGKLNDPGAAYQFLLKPVKSIEKVDDKHMKVTLNEPYAPFLSVGVGVRVGDRARRPPSKPTPTSSPTSPSAPGRSWWRAMSAARRSCWSRIRTTGSWAPTASRCPISTRSSCSMCRRAMRGCSACRTATTTRRRSCPSTRPRRSSETPDMTLEVAEIFRLDYVYLNHSKKPLDDKRIRLAMNYAANLRGDQQGGVLRLRRDPELVSMPKMNFWSADVAPIALRHREGQGAGAEAGYDGTPIKLLVDTGNAPSKQVATILQQGWQRSRPEGGDRGAGCRHRPGTSVVDGSYMAYVSYITSDINDDDELRRCRPIPRRPAPRASSRATRTTR